MAHFTEPTRTSLKSAKTGRIYAYEPHARDPYGPTSRRGVVRQMESDDALHAKNEAARRLKDPVIVDERTDSQRLRDDITTRSQPEGTPESRILTLKGLAATAADRAANAVSPSDRQRATRQAERMNVLLKAAEDKLAQQHEQQQRRERPEYTSALATAEAEYQAMLAKSDIPSSFVTDAKARRDALIESAEVDPFFAGVAAAKKALTLWREDECARLREKSATIRAEIDRQLAEAGLPTE